jgi:pimeloyl-ACP methyl ester carboxylesterase
MAPPLARLALLLGSVCVFSLTAMAHAAAPKAPAAASAAGALPPNTAWRSTSCRLSGVETGAWCWELPRPLDPAQPQGPQITLHFAVIPALARNKLPDPVLFFAGGPGQSAIELAGPVLGILQRLNNRRDIVLIDQRGTGRSAPLHCDDTPAALPLREALDSERMLQRLAECRSTLSKLPHGDLRRYTTSIAAADVEAVRQALGADKLNLVGGSYGTRIALEVLRQQPQHVRRIIIDGVAPPDMVLPMSFSTDAQAAFDALLQSCDAKAAAAVQDKACVVRFPELRAQWQAVWQSLPREVRVQHPHTGAEETVTLSRDVVANALRQPLYVPSLASALPFAISEAAQGRFTPFVGLTSAMGSNRRMRMATGMHFSVICAEDMPRLGQSTDKPGADFGDSALKVYQRVCADWPRGEVPAAFYAVPPSPAPALVLSGAVDPVTPPRHGERVAKALGAKARHVVVPNAGHGLLTMGCMRDVVFRFINAANDEEAMGLKGADCAALLPWPPAFAPFSLGAPGAR